MAMRQTVTVHVRITSPARNARRFVGPNRGVSVSVEAHATIQERPGGGGGIGDSDIERPVRPPLPHGDASGLHTAGGPSLLHSVEREVTTVEVRLGGGPWRHARKSNNNSRHWFGETGTVDSGGRQQISARAFYLGPPDFINHQGFAQHEITVEVDDIPPEVQLRRVQPGTRLSVEGSRIDVTVEGTAEDRRSGVDRVLVGVDRANQRATDESGEWEEWKYQLTLSGIGEHKICAQAFDRVGNASREVSQTVRLIDTGDPELTIDEPPNNTTFVWPKDGRLSVAVAGSATDAGSGVAAVQWRIGDDGDFQAVDTPPDRRGRWETRVPIPAPGGHAVTFICRDKADQHPGGPSEPNSATAVLTITADDNPQVITIDEPRSPHRVVIEPDGTGVTVEVRGTASDELMALVGVEWSLDSGDFQAAEPRQGDDWTAWRFAVRIDRSGVYTVRVRARDRSEQTSAPAELIIRAQEEVV